MKPHRFILIGLVLAITSELATSGEEVVTLPKKENFHLYLLVGQSNMAGRGKVSAADTIPIPRVLTLTKNKEWQPAIDPLHFDKPVAGVGLGRTFGIRLAESSSPDVAIGLIPCAVGGSPISTWQPGGYHEQTKSHPYDDAVERTMFAIDRGTLKGILWHQGESDSKMGLAEAYEKKLHELIDRFRVQFNAPNIPFIVGQMGQFSERPWSDAKLRVDRVHRSLPEKVPHTAFVSSDGLRHKGDEIHFNADGFRELGLRYAKAYQDLIDKSVKHATKD